MRHSFQGIAEWQTALRSIANQLEDLERRARRSQPGEDGLTGELVFQLEDDGGDADDAGR